MENEFHRISLRQGLGGIEIYPYLADWLRDELDGKHDPHLNRKLLLRQKEGSGPYGAPIESFNLPR